MESRVRRCVSVLWWTCTWSAVIAGPYVAYAYLWDCVPSTSCMAPKVDCIREAAVDAWALLTQRMFVLSGAAVVLFATRGVYMGPRARASRALRSLLASAALALLCAAAFRTGIDGLLDASVNVTVRLMVIAGVGVVAMRFVR